MQELPQPIRRGARVEARGEPWQVIDVDPFDRVSLVTLRGVGPGNAASIARVLTPFDRLTPLAKANRLRLRSRQSVLRAALGAIADAAAWRVCWTAAAAAIDIRAWQLEPAHAVLAGATRLLLADEVGLGKTIQALLIASELSARGVVRRLLILTPAPLREQWAHEGERFALDAAVFDHATLAAFAATLPPGVNPWDTAPRIIASIDLVKRAEVRQALDATSFDLLVVDEAHHLTPGSDRAAVVADLATRTPFVVLVTATPHSGDSEAFRFLCRIGEVAASEPMAVFRRRARDVRRRARRVRTIPVPPTDAERAMLDGALAYASLVWRDAGTGGRLAASVIARRTCSSALAAGATIARRLALLGGESAEDQPRLPWEDETTDASVADAVLAYPGLIDRAAETRWLERLRDLAAAAAVQPSKLSALRRFLVRTHEHVLVFSEYRDVVEWCVAGVSDLASVGMLHGGMAPIARRDAIADFNEGRTRVLVATDAAGEGLNLHDHCRLVVNLELPWNPLRLEQRAGRVDRIGQRRRVHVRHLVHRGSYEDLVLARLDARRRTAAGELEVVSLNDEAVAACVLGGAALPDVPQTSTAEPAPDEASAAAIRHTRRRQAEATPPASALVARQSAHGIARALILLYGVDCVDGDGRCVQQDIVGLRIALPMPSGRRLSRPFVHAVHADRSVRAVLLETVATRAITTRASLAAVASRLDARLSGLRRALAARSADVLVQGSLFDRREEQRGHALRSMTARWDEHLRERQRVVRALATLELDEPRLLAAWLSD